MSAPWDYIAKLVCIGDSGCGKSSLTIRLCEGRFSPHHDVTIGVEFGSRIVPVGPPLGGSSSTGSRAGAASSSSSYSTPPTGLSATTTTTSASPKAATDHSSPSQQQQQQQQPATTTIGLPEPPRDSSTATAPQKHMKLSLWDTAGQETYKSVTRSYFRGASGALLVFDLSRRQTFEHVTHWLNDLRQIAEPDIVVVLVGNKADLTTQDGDDDDVGHQQQQDDDGDNSNTSINTSSDNNNNNNHDSNMANKQSTAKRQVSRHEAESWARRNGILEYVETSAKSGQNVENAFMRVADRIYHNIQAGRYDLNDRRSGVKGPATAAAANAAAARQARLVAGGGNAMSGACC